MYSCLENINKEQDLFDVWAKDRDEEIYITEVETNGYNLTTVSKDSRTKDLCHVAVIDEAC